MNQDFMQVLLDKSGSGFVGSDPVAFWSVRIAFSNGASGRLAEGIDRDAVIAHAIARARTLLRGLEDIQNAGKGVANVN